MTYTKLNTTNNGRGRLHTAISAGAATIILDSGQGGLFPSSGPFVITVEQLDTTSPLEIQPVLKREVMLIGSRSVDTLSITTRAYESVAVSDTATTEAATAYAFDAQSVVELRVTSGLLDRIQDNMVSLDAQLALKLGISDYQNGGNLYANTTTGNDSYAITLSPIIGSYVAGQRFSFLTDVGNTGAATLNVNSLGAKTIKKLHDQDLATGDIEAGQIVEVEYDGTNFQMLSQIAQLAVVASNSIQSSFTVGESVVAGDVCFNEIPNATFANALGLLDIGKYATDTRRHFAMIGSGTAGTTFKIGLMKVSSPSATFSYRLESDDGSGNPSGTIYPTTSAGTIAAASVNTTMTDTTITISSLTIPLGTPVHVVMWAGTYGSETINATNYYRVAVHTNHTRVQRARAYNGTSWVDTYTTGDLTTGSYASKSFTIGSGDLQQLWLTKGGNRLFVGDTTGLISTYTLSTPFDVSTAVTASSTFNTSTQDTQQRKFFFRDDGLAMYVMGTQNSKIYQYTLTTPWDLSTCSYASKSFSTPAGSSGYGCWFSPDGTRVIFSHSNGTFYSATMSTPWDVSTCATDQTEVDASVTARATESFQESQDGTTYGFVMDYYGKNLFVMGYGNNTIYHYTLSTPFEIDTISYSGLSLSTGSQTTQPIGCCIAGAYMYVVDNPLAKIFQYNMSTALTDNPTAYCTGTLFLSNYWAKCSSDYPYKLGEEYFAAEAKSIGQTTKFDTYGLITTVTGVVQDTPYYTGKTHGSITASPNRNAHLVGIARSTASLDLRVERTAALQFQRNTVTASGAVVYTHSLGRTPTKIIFNMTATNQSSNGIWDGRTNSCTSFFNASSRNSWNSRYSIHYNDGATGNNHYGYVTAATKTTFTITWVKTGGTGPTININAILTG